MAVVVLGSVNVDLTIALERLPRPGETVSGGVLSRGHGGKGANQAVAAARAGADVRFIGAVGRDAAGDEVLVALAAAGVDVGDVRLVDGATGTALISVDTAGENQIAVAPGANREITADGIEVAPVGLALAQLEVPLDAVHDFFVRARSAGALSVLNAAPIRAEAVDDVREALAVVDVLVVNRRELEALTGAADGATAGDVERAAASLRGTAPQRVVVTLGSAGVLGIGADGAVIRIPAHPVPVVDSVGAGDAFCGVLAAVLAAERSFAEALQRANAAGALATTRPGARSSPTAAEIDTFLREASVP